MSRFFFQIGEISVCRKATKQRHRVPDVRGVPLYVPRSVREPQVPAGSVSHAQEGPSDGIRQTHRVPSVCQRSVLGDDHDADADGLKIGNVIC